MAGPKRRRKQREAKWLQDQLEGSQEGQAGPSAGQWYVLDCLTWTKTPGLSHREAQELWSSLPKAMILGMDCYQKKPAPGRADFDAGKLP